jgi:hypothetical protein
VQSHVRYDPELVVNDEESRLLIEAVSLLVQRQREAEAWLAEQFRQTLLSDSALDRRMAELEERLGRIQARLGTLAAEVDPNLASVADIARLEQGLESLTNGAAGFPARPQTLTVVPSQTPPPSLDLPPRPRSASPRAAAESWRPLDEAPRVATEASRAPTEALRAVRSDPTFGAAARGQVNNGKLQRAAGPWPSGAPRGEAVEDDARGDAATGQAATAADAEPRPRYAAAGDAARGHVAAGHAAVGDAASGHMAPRYAPDGDAAPGHVASAYGAVGDAAAGGDGPRRASAWDALGATPRERWGVALMGGGALALLYLVLRGLGFS